jgi:hypothetical protein
MLAGGQVRKRNDVLMLDGRRPSAVSSNSIGSVKELIAVVRFAP